ncbi:MAG: hypothetical protein PVJ53_01815 [Desulfobacterales bacterium]|jgi:hypothetical protein
MTPVQQRNLIIVLLSAGTLILLIAAGIALTRSQRDVPIAAPANVATAEPSFTFFELDRGTILTRDLRKSLSEKLGSDAIAHSTPLDLTVFERAFMQAHLPVLDELNQQLNPRAGERKEHDTTRLTYHRATKQNLPFRFIELFFSNRTGLPLYFVINPTSDFEDTIATLTSKYGPPRMVPTEHADDSVRLWEREGDILAAITFRRRNGRLVQELRMVFVENLQQLIESEKQALRQQNRSTRQAGQSAF